MLSTAINPTIAKRSRIRRTTRGTISIITLLILTLSVCLFAAAVGAIYAPSPIASAPSPIAALTTAEVRDSYGRLPLAFEANVGQANKSVDFVARGAGYTLALSPSGAALALTLQSDNSPQSAESSLSDPERSGVATRSNRANNTRQSVTLPRILRMGLVGGDKSALAIGTDKLPGKVNYFIGSDPRLWRTDVSTFERVRYGNVYPGVDVVYYGNQRQLEYDFVVAPGRDPGVVKLQFKGADKVEVDAAGDLLLTLGESVIRQPKPVVYQEAGDERRTVEGAYAVGANGEVGFRVGVYDNTTPLVIDPVLVYSTYLGGTGTDDGVDIAVDSFGSAYTCGSTLSPNFPMANALDATFASGQFGGQRDAFVTKLNPDGTALVYSTYLGGSGNVVTPNINGDDLCFGIRVDGLGRAYLAGETHSDDFPTANAIQATFGSGGLSDAFVTKLNAAGSALVFSTYLGGDTFDAAADIALDSSNNIYITGRSTSSNYPTLNPIQASYSGGPGADVIITKINAAGTALVYSTYLGGNAGQEGGFENGTGIDVDPAGNAYITGQTRSTNFPTANPIQASFGGGFPDGDAFITKINAAGSALVFSTYLGGSENDLGTDIDVDSAGVAHVSGFTASTNFPTANAFQSTFGGGTNDAFVTKLNAAGSAFAYSTYLGGTGSDAGNDIAVDSAGNTYVAGGTASTNFPLANAVQAVLASATGDTFVTKFNAAGSALVYSTYLGGNGGERANAIALDEKGDAYVTGLTESTDFPTLTPVQAANGGGIDGFVYKLSDPAATTPTPSPTPTCPQPLNYTVSNTSLVLGGDAFEINGNNNHSITLTAGTPNDDRFMGGFFIFPGRSTTPNGVYTGTVTQIITFNDGPSATVSRNIIYTATNTQRRVDFHLGETKTVDLGPLGKVDVTLKDIIGVYALSNNTTAILVFPSFNDDATFLLHDVPGSPCAPPDVSIAVSPSSVTEDGATNLVYTLTRTGATTSPLTVNFSVGGTATFNTDYSQSGAATFTSSSGTATFIAGSSTAIITIDPTLDNIVETNETVILTVTSGTGYNVGNPSTATGTITNDDATPSLSINDVTIAEGDSGTVNAVFTVTLSAPSSFEVTVNFATADGTATQPSDYQSTNGLLTFNPGEVSKTISVPVNGNAANEPNETFFVNLSNATNAGIGDTQGMGTILNDDTPVLNFSLMNYTVSESGGSAQITVNRTGDPNPAVSVDFMTTDNSNPADFVLCSSNPAGTASSRCDFNTALGTLKFAAGEISKTFDVLITQDSYVEGTESLQLFLSNPTGGAVLGNQSTSSLQIQDDVPETTTNPILDARNFVRQNYHDFLNREPDQPGWDFWTDNITKCNDPARRPAGQTLEQCIDRQRETTSAAFFLSPEFQYTGFYIYCVYKGSLGRMPTFLELMRDVQQVSRGIVVNNAISGATIELNRAQFETEFIQRAEFLGIYGALDNQGYVDKLFQTTGVAVSAADKQALVDGLNGLTETRATVLHKVTNGTRVIAEGQADIIAAYGKTFTDSQFNPAFVQMEYLGYLRRNSDAAGFTHWLDKMNTFGGDFLLAEMVKSFLMSPEYLQRFAAP